MQGGDGVGTTRKFEPENRHAEFFMRIVRILAAKAQESLRSQSQPVSHGAEVLFEEHRVEAVMTSGHRCVGGEDDLAGNTCRSFIEVDSFFLHSIANGFKNRKSAVTFVEVKNSRRKTHRLEGAESTDTQQEFLSDADTPISAVQAGRQISIFGGISFDVRVQQEKLDSSNFHTPYPGPDGAVARFRLNHHRLAVLADCRLHGSLFNIGFEIVLPLPSVDIEALAKVTLSIEQSDANKRNAQV